MGESVSKLTIDAGVQGGAAAASELQKVATSIDATGAAAQAAAKQAEELAAAQETLSAKMAAVRLEADLAAERELKATIESEAAAADEAARSLEAMRRELELTRIEAEAVAERGLKEELAAEAAAAEASAASQQKLSRMLASVAEEATAVAAVESQEALAESLRLQAEAAEAARPAVEALAEAQERLAKLRALQAEGPEGRSVGEMLAFNDAIEKQQSLIRTLGGEQQGFNTKTQDLVGILNRINPRLGEMGLGLLRLSRLAGDAGTANLSLGKSLEAVGGFLKGNVASIALLGAAYLAYSAISQVQKVWERDQEDLRKAADEATRYRQALVDLNKERGQQQQEIEDIAGRRKGGGFRSAEESTAAQQLAGRIKQELPQLPQSVVNDTVGNLAGRGLSDNEIKRAAIAAHQNRLKFDPALDAKQQIDKFRDAERTGSHLTDRFIGLENEQRNAARQSAVRTIRTAGSEDAPTKDEIKDALREVIGKTGAKVENLELLAELASKRGKIEDIANLYGLSPDAKVARAVEAGVGVGPDGKRTASDADIEAAVRHMESLARAAEQLDRSLKENTAATQQNSQRTSGRSGAVKNGTTVFHGS